MPRRRSCCPGPCARRGTCRRGDRVASRVLGERAPLGKAEGLREAKQWLRGLPRAEAEALAARLSKGELPLTVSPLKPPAATAAAGDKGDRPYAHPYY
jgi:hypothetical protein